MPGKTETSRQRRVEVWLPTFEAKDRWAAAAQERRMSVSKFVMTCVEQVLDGGDPDAYEALRKEMDDLANDNEQLLRRVEKLDLLTAKQETDLQHYRRLQLENPLGMRTIDPKLMAIFMNARDDEGRHRVLTPADLHKRMRVSKDDVEALNLINTNLEMMETGGLVVRTRQGWRWDAPTD